MPVSTDDLLFGTVEDGKYTGPTTDTSKTTRKLGTDKLGKQEFLQLLVAQMQYQDPLEPTSNTEYIAQLATFSQVEQLENLNTAYTNTQAFALVGQTVTVSSINSATNTVTTKEGVVDFVTIEKGKAYLSIEGVKYPADDISEIKSVDYAYEQNKPKVSKAAWSYNGNNPSDASVSLDFGSGTAKAEAVVLMFGSDYAISGSALTLEDGKLTVSKDALAQLPNGNYDVTFIFDDPRSTNVTGQVTITVVNSTVEEQKPEEDSGNTEPEEDGTGENTTSE